jgi:tagatose-1,6-bisphosphate aldolase
MKSINKELRNYAYDLVIFYHKDKTININDIPNDDLDKFCSLIINNDLTFGNEILGSDNNSFDSNILPALINYLKNSSDKCNENLFLDNVKSGIRNYLHHNIVILLDNALEDFIFEEKIQAA